MQERLRSSERARQIGDEYSAIRFVRFSGGSNSPTTWDQTTQKPKKKRYCLKNVSLICDLSD